jgi:hypothetical protein
MQPAATAAASVGEVQRVRWEAVSGCMCMRVTVLSSASVCGVWHTVVATPAAAAADAAARVMVTC